MKRRETWADYTQLFLEMAQTLMREWKIERPSYETLPSRELDLAVDCWCAIQVANLGLTLDVPSEVRPWMIARLTMAAGHTLHFSAVGEPDWPMDRDSLTQLLNHEWHRVLREQWAAIGKRRRRKRIRRRVKVIVLAVVAAILLGGIGMRLLR